MSLQAGEIIDGKYRIVRLLGEGGMGAVYEGENTRIHRKVAIKVLHAAVAAKADVVQRFEREAQAAGRIGSEHIVEVLDLGNLPTGDRFMVMEFLEGESLGDRIKRRKRMPANEVARVIHELLEGLAAAHAQSIIHRDLKPDNVYLLANKSGQRDFVKVLDFGVSKFSALDADMSMTKTGAVMGTPFYMSPEQARGGKIDQRSDLYSVGVVAYQAVTGRVPFHAETFNELVFKIALESPEPAELASPGLDPSFAAIIAKSMARDSAARYQTAKEFQAAIAQWMMMAPASPDGPNGTIPIAPGINLGPTPSFAGGVPNALGQSGNALGQSGNALGQSGNALGQSGNALGQSAQQLAMSQGGMAMTAPQPRTSGAMIAIGLVSVLLLGGGAFGAYRFLGSKPAPTPAAPVVTAAKTAPPATPTATTAATPAPTAAETAAPTATGAVAAVNTAVPEAPTAVVPKVGGPLPKGKTPGTGAKAAPTAAATAPKSGGGRSVSGDL